MEAPTRIDPRTVLDRRRRLHFSSLAEVEAEATRLSSLVDGGNSVRADLAGPEARVVHLANLPLGQMTGHIGLTLGLAVDGIDFRFPPLMRLMARMLRHQMLSGRISAPYEAPARLNARIQPDRAMRAAEGLALLQKEFKRFADAAELRENALFGRLSRDEWTEATCTHAAWHFSFILER